MLFVPPDVRGGRRILEYSAELARLEEFVDKLLNKYSQLKSEYSYNFV